MWTSWLERTLGAHDPAEYAERRALRTEIDDEPQMISPSPLAPGVASPPLPRQRESLVPAKGEGLALCS